MPTETEGFPPEPDLPLPQRTPGEALARALPGFLTGVSEGSWHAIPQESMGYCPADSVTYATCGALVRVTKYGTYNRAGVPVAHGPCQACAWAVAASGGRAAMEAEADRLEPPPDDAGALGEATGGYPALAAAVCRVLIEDAAKPDSRYGLDHPATVQLLAMAAAHTPVLLLCEACSEEECDHGGEPCPGKAACQACSLQDGDWAGEWQGRYREECTVAAPCQVLLTLAKSAGVE